VGACLEEPVEKQAGSWLLLHETVGQEIIRGFGTCVFLALAVKQEWRFDDICGFRFDADVGVVVRLAFGGGEEAGREI
jgi:hypothetical protein